jgi:putative hydrolase of the HAD superfamily
VSAGRAEQRGAGDKRVPFQHFGLRNYLRVSLSSCYLGLRKPDLVIYQRALEILGRPAERILLIDDRADNVAVAMDAGMKAIHFVGAGALRRELERLAGFVSGFWHRAPT